MLSCSLGDRSDLSPLWCQVLPSQKCRIVVSKTGLGYKAELLFGSPIFSLKSDLVTKVTTDADQLRFTLSDITVGCESINCLYLTILQFSNLFIY